MDVSSNDQRRIQLDQVGLADENLLRLLDKGLDLLLCEVDWLDAEVWGVCSDVLSHFQQGVDDVV